MPTTLEEFLPIAIEEQKAVLDNLKQLGKREHELAQ